MIDKAQIKSMLDAREVIGIDLGAPLSSDSTSNIWACPFHSEKTSGAFHVFHDGYKCFSCGTWGDIFTWRQLQHGETFIEALENLAQMAGIDIERELASPTDQRSQDARLLEIKRQNAERVALELEEKIKKAQEVLNELRHSMRWVQYHELMPLQARELWRKRLTMQNDPACADFWIVNWQLGYTSDFRLWYKNIQQEHITPTLTIPIWGEGWECNGIKHRILAPLPGHESDKYRPDVAGIPSSPFFANPDVTTGDLLLVEGEIKAMVACITGDMPHMQTAGLPGKVPDASLFDKFERYGSIYLLLDPDAFERPSPDRPSGVERAIGILGIDRVAVIQLAMKVDDAVAKGVINKDGIKRMIRAARPAHKFLRETR